MLDAALNTSTNALLADAAHQRPPWCRYMGNLGKNRVRFNHRKRVLLIVTFKNPIGSSINDCHPNTENF